MILGIELVEPFQNELGMAFVLGKDNGLADAVAARHLDATIHQILQDNIHGGFVEHKLVELGRGDKVRQQVILDKILLVPFFVLVGQIIVGDALVQKLGFHLVVVVGHQHMILIHGGFIVIGVCGHAVLHLEEIVGIAVYICFRGSRQAHHIRIKILKDRSVFLKNTAVALVNDDEVKVRRGEQFPPIDRFGIVNGIKHSGIG